MPRDFVPCEYTERELTHPVTDDTIKRCQVIECFEGVQLATRGILFTMSLDSHAYHLDTRSGTDDDHQRQHLFETFYAAMAALE